MKKLVLIEDDPDLYALLRYNLEREGFRVSGAQHGAGAVDLCARERPDLILLDVMLPDCDGFDLCRLMRAKAQLAATPIIFLSARASETDRVIGLELGAVDYIVKPFFMREVIARIRVQFRVRREGPNLMRSAGIELDPRSCSVTQHGSEVFLTATEFRLLEFLMSRPGAIFSRRQLLDAVWGYDRTVTERTVDVYILRLRQKLASGDGDSSFIRCVRGFGYGFREDRAEMSHRPWRTQT
jgi:two-component system phosphate regulon response regulator PhoB